MRTFYNTLLWMLAPAAFASALTEPIPVPVISTACTVGGQSVACTGQYGSDSVLAMASASVVGLNSDSALLVNAWADAESGSVNPGPLFFTLGSSAIASVSLDFFAATDGPQRQGFASFLLGTSGEHGTGVGATESMFAQGLGSCEMQCQSLGQLVPFELGVPFEIGLSIFASGGSGQHEYNGGSGNAALRLQLFEADGTTSVVIFDPPGPAVPEPRSLFLVAIGLVGMLTSKRSLRSIPHRLYEKLMDRFIGIDSSGYFRPAELEGPECLEYTPVPYRAAQRLLGSVEVSHNDVFIEYGCGKGRILALAAAQPYRKVIGVEISPPLCREAELNLKRARLKRRCSAIEILPANAMAFKVPDDATVLFFGNPFNGDVMRAVVWNIRASYLRNPRKIRFLVYNQHGFVENNAAGGWIAPVYREQRSFPPASVCLFETRHVSRHSVGIMDQQGNLVSIPASSRADADAKARELAGWRWSWWRGWTQTGNGTTVIVTERTSRGSATPAASRRN